MGTINFKCFENTKINKCFIKCRKQKPKQNNLKIQRQNSENIILFKKPNENISLSKMIKNMDQGINIIIDEDYKILSYRKSDKMKNYLFDDENDVNNIIGKNLHNIKISDCMKDLLINLVNKIYQDKMYIGCIIEINNDEHLICGLPISSNLLENNDTLGVLICKIPLIYCIFNDFYSK